MPYKQQGLSLRKSLVNAKSESKMRTAVGTGQWEEVKWNKREAVDGTSGSRESGTRDGRLFIGISLHTDPLILPTPPPNKAMHLQVRAGQNKAGQSSISASSSQLPGEMQALTSISKP